ncbi:MAG: glycosyltransferase, partial [Lachnospiraceae bacterium]|nr:glycosyltransferase [Lachnospiraceae bacterium]
MAKISIIVPFYNSERYVKRCLDSLLHQTIGLQNLELILVDDASTDRTLDLLKEYEKQYPEQIILIPCSQNGRQGTARNIGLQYATSPYIAFVDSDDWVETDMYEKMYDKITAYNCDIVVCRFVRDDGNMRAETDHKNYDVNKKTTGEKDAFINIENDRQREELLVNRKIGGVWDRLFK